MVPDCQSRTTSSRQLHRRFPRQKPIGIILCPSQGKSGIFFMNTAYKNSPFYNCWVGLTEIHVVCSCTRRLHRVRHPDGAHSTRFAGDVTYKGDAGKTGWSVPVWTKVFLTPNMAWCKHESKRTRGRRMKQGKRMCVNVRYIWNRLRGAR